MQRIVIIGSSGSGKSTLARHLGAQLSLPVIHLDNYYWHPGWVGTPQPAWEKIVNEFVSQERWIIDGNYRRTLEVRIQGADTIVFLDLPPWLCAWRSLKRRIQYRNRPRPDMAPGCREKLFSVETIQFLRRVWNYPQRARPDIAQRLRSLPAMKQVYWLNSPKEVSQFLSESFSYEPIYMGWPLVNPDT